jgi:hypothetical protein
VITSNQVVIWDTVCALGTGARRGPGRLFATSPAMAHA